MIYLTDPEEVFPTGPEDGSAVQFSTRLYSNPHPPHLPKRISGMTETGGGFSKSEPSTLSINLF